MKNAIWMFLGLFLVAAPAFADNINEAYNGAGTPASSNQDTSTVDLSDKDTDQPVQSPSFENTTPAGQAPGGPVSQ